MNEYEIMHDGNNIIIKQSKSFGFEWKWMIIWNVNLKMLEWDELPGRNHNTNVIDNKIENMTIYNQYVSNITKLFGSING